MTLIVDTSGWLIGGNLDGKAYTDRLNALGEKEWELVAVFDTNMTHGATRQVVATLKRPLR